MTVYTDSEKNAHDDKVLEVLIDMWHNQATIIKWLSKIAENTK